MNSRALSTFLVSLCLSTNSALCAIVYSPGPASQSPPLQYPPSRNVDLDSDGQADFSVWSSGAICTDDYPSSFCSWPYYVGAAGTNQILITGYDALLQTFGAEIGRNAPSGAVWGTPWYGAGLAAYWWSLYGQVIDGEVVYSGWAGPIGGLGVAYLGGGFYAGDGPHYGWVRVRLPRPDGGQGGLLFEIAPVVVDWAYETRPDTPIRAGDIGSAGESVQFTVEWSNPLRRSRNPGQDLGTGSFILTGNRLRGELSLAGQLAAAQVIGPGNQGKKADPVLDFGQPLVASAGHTAFFREATLTHPQIVKLLHGKYQVTVDNGALTGQILPAAPAR
jgi:hypothetical protein